MTNPDSAATISSSQRDQRNGRSIKIYVHIITHIICAFDLIGRVCVPIAFHLTPDNKTVIYTRFVPTTTVGQTFVLTVCYNLYYFSEIIFLCPKTLIIIRMSNTYFRCHMSREYLFSRFFCFVFSMGFAKICPIRIIGNAIMILYTLRMNHDEVIEEEKKNKRHQTPKDKFEYFFSNTFKIRKMLDRLLSTLFVFFRVNSGFKSSV